MSAEEFSLTWDNHHSTLVAVFKKLLKNGILVDCTIAAEGQYLKAHKIILSACSPYFELLFHQENEKNPIVVLKDVKFRELKAIIEFIYSGNVKVPEDHLGDFVDAAESLQIKGIGGGNQKKFFQSAAQIRSERAQSPQREDHTSPTPQKRRRTYEDSAIDMPSGSRNRMSECDIPSSIPVDLPSGSQIEQRIGIPSVSNSASAARSSSVLSEQTIATNSPVSFAEPSSSPLDVELPDVGNIVKHEPEPISEVYLPEMDFETKEEDATVLDSGGGIAENSLNVNTPHSTNQYPAFPTALQSTSTGSDNVFLTTAEQAEHTYSQEAAARAASAPPPTPALTRAPPPRPGSAPEARALRDGSGGVGVALASAGARKRRLSASSSFVGSEPEPAQSAGDRGVESKSRSAQGTSKAKPTRSTEDAGPDKPRKLKPAHAKEHPDVACDDRWDASGSQLQSASASTALSMQGAPVRRPLSSGVIVDEERVMEPKGAQGQTLRSSASSRKSVAGSEVHKSTQKQLQATLSRLTCGGEVKVQRVQPPSPVRVSSSDSAGSAVDSVAADSTRTDVAPQARIGARQLQCPKCKAMFARPTDFQKHSCLPKAPGPGLICAYCGKTLPDAPALIEHARTHVRAPDSAPGSAPTPARGTPPARCPSPQVQRRFRCHSCTAGFNVVANLLHHLRVVHGQR